MPEVAEERRESTMEENYEDRRLHPRTEFAYPVSFGLIMPGQAPRGFQGYIKDISLGGACIAVEQRFGLAKRDDLKGLRVKMEISQPEQDSLFLFSVIRWVRMKESKKIWQMLLGLEFEEMAPWQKERLEKFLSLRGKDQEMLWRLWDGYQQAAAR
ncbi:MAG TPA: PilZ domain-containing protein [Candidatus Bathyarchaeia archaeon]|nr:PilZ domain-containing protein [Candidatus Bathyarchaeia archaeon]